MRRKLLIIAGIIILVVAIPVVRKTTSGGEGQTVRTTAVARHSIRSSVLASGHLHHEEQVNLTTEVIGRVTDLLVGEGDAVKQGQLLLRIDDTTYLASVEQQKAQVKLQKIAIKRRTIQLDTTERQWARKNKLYEQGLIDQGTFDTATNARDLARVDLASSREQLLLAKAKLAQAEDRLRKTRVYSPIDGIVTSLDIKVGETAIASSTNIPGSALMTIANPHSIHAELNVDEADIANVEVGQKVNIYAIAYPNQPISGIIDSIAVSAKVPEGSQSLSFAVKVRLNPVNGVDLRPGMSCRAEIFTTKAQELLTVPIQAIIVEENRTLGTKSYSVFIMQNNHARRVPVELGISNDTYQQVTNGLQKGQEVIIGPDRVLHSLVDGDVVHLDTTDRSASIKPHQNPPRTDSRLIGGPASRTHRAAA